LSEIETVQALLSAGRSHAEVSRQTGVPIGTVRRWAHGRLPRKALAALGPAGLCDRCGAEGHEFGALPAPTYAYLLGMYLGDGHVSRHGSGTYVLRLALDAAYPGIVAEAAQAIEAIRRRRPWIGRDPRSRCMRVASYWRSWPCLFPQHGPGRKHTRPIELHTWQREMVEREPRPFLRALIQTDGWRGLNRVRVKGREYAYVRYQFSNRSSDIKRLFTDACDELGVEWRRWGEHHISIARRASVAELDRFIGAKA
jgi:hypothetical protein